MIAKIRSGSSFGGCVRYVVQKRGAEVLLGDGIRLADVSQMISDFNLQRKINPDLQKAVGHISLNWSEVDQLDSQLMMTIAREYLLQMKILATQILVVRHYDAGHPHIHIIYNRVDNLGRTISDSHERRRNEKVCKALTKEYGLFIAEGKVMVNRERLKGADKLKYEIHDTLKGVLNEANSWQELERLLLIKGVKLHYHLKGNSAVVQGISFQKGICVFKGSEIDRSFSYGKLDKQLELQNKLEKTSGLYKEYLHRNQQKGISR